MNTRDDNFILIRMYILLRIVIVIVYHITYCHSWTADDRLNGSEAHTSFVTNLIHIVIFQL
jgi:hypothetical protein